MIDFIQPAPVKSPAIADLESLSLGDTPLNQGIAVMGIIFASLCFVSGDSNIVKALLLFLEPVDLFPNQVGLELSSTPAYSHARPTVAI